MPAEQFRAAVIPTITFSGELREIAELFVSINSTGKKLTGQERRHAFSEQSNVLKAATKLAEDHRDFFLKKHVSPLARWIEVSDHPGSLTR